MRIGLLVPEIFKFKSSQNRSMGIFPDAQGQLTSQSMVGSGRISNSIKSLWLVVLDTCKNEDQNKNEGDRVATSL